MIAFDSETKQAYKNDDREIKVMGNLYLAKKRISKNLFNINGQINVKQNDGSITNKNTVQGNVLIAGTNGWYDYGSGQQFTNLNGKTFTITAKCISYGTGTGGVFAIGDNYNQVAYKHLDLNETGSITYTATSNNIIVGFATDNGENAQYTDIQLEIGNMATDYEEYGTYVNDYGNTNATSKNLLNAQKYFAGYYNQNNFTFSKTNYYYNETEYIDIDEIGLEVENDYIYSINILSNYNNYDENITIIGYDENYNYVYEKSGTASKLGLIKCLFNLTSNVKYIVIRLNRSDEAETNTIQVNNIQITKGNKFIPYELYNSSPFRLTEENECQILSFNINEKTDVYYTSLPYNEMTIEVDNEKGYFTDYDPESIVNKLNQDCYVDLFMNINDGDYYKIMTMNFDKISSSDYEKAKLSFKSNISTLSNLTLRDKNLDIFTNLQNIFKSTLRDLLKINYGINLLCDNNTDDIMFVTTQKNSITIQNMLLNAGTKFGTLEKAVLTLNDSQDNLVQRTWKSSPQDTILLDYQQEKPIVKREDVYRGVQRKYISSGNWVSSSETFNYVLSGKLTSARETIVLFNSNYRINDFTSSNITISGGVNVSVYGTNTYELLELLIEGNIGDEYTITFNKENILKKDSDNYVEQIIGSTDDTTKILKITEKAPLQSGYYNFILSEKQVKSNIEAKIFGLPYLEIGDTVEIETENAKILMTITEIDMNFDGGLLETIKGYELGWDALFPSDTLYPSDDLYPNTPI